MTDSVFSILFMFQFGQKPIDVIGSWNPRLSADEKARIRQMLKEAIDKCQTQK